MASPTIVMLAPQASPNMSFSCPSGSVYLSSSIGLLTNVLFGDLNSLQSQGCTLLTPRNNVSTTRAPTSSDDYTADYGVGSEWVFVNSGTANVYVCTAMGTSPGTAT